MRQSPAPKPGAQRIFESTYERLMWIASEAKSRSLTPEEKKVLALYRREQPASYRMLIALVDEQFAAKRKVS